MISSIYSKVVQVLFAIGTIVIVIAGFAAATIVLLMGWAYDKTSGIVGSNLMFR